MNTKLPLRSLLVAIGIVTLASGLAACSDDASTVESSGTAQVVGPVIAEAADVDGTTVQVALTRVLVINADDPAAWTATIEDPAILSFTAGTADGDAEFNPGFEPLAQGSTSVTMTDGTSTVTFTVEVTD